MDSGGLNGSMMDPMKMSDAELLEPPTATAVPDQLNAEQVKSDTNEEVKALELKLKAMEEERNSKITEIKKAQNEISNLKEEASKLKKDNADLLEKAELNEILKLKSRVEEVSASKNVQKEDKQCKMLTEQYKCRMITTIGAF